MAFQKSSGFLEFHERIGNFRLGSSPPLHVNDGKAQEGYASPHCLWGMGEKASEAFRCNGNPMTAVHGPQDLLSRSSRGESICSDPPFQNV